MLEIEIILLLLFIGSIAGFVAGLFGIGGGIIVIPITLWVLDLQNIDAGHIQHIAIGTSFFVMMFTTFISSWAQFKQNAIRWDILKSMVPGLVFGSVIGSFLASRIPSQNLQIVFIFFSYLVAVKTLIGFNPKNSWDLPKPLGIASVGTFIGSVSSFLGIGGGILNVPFMLSCKVSIKEAIGTSASLSWVVAFMGSLSYFFLGMQTPNLPEYTIGFCYLPIAITLTITTTLFAPLGVKMAHKFSPRLLQTIFAILLLVITSQILFKWVID